MNVWKPPNKSDFESEINVMIVWKKLKTKLSRSGIFVYDKINTNK